MRSLGNCLIGEVKPMDNKSAEIIELRSKIEDSVGRVMHTPADFDFLSGAIWEMIRQYISPTTLKRTWGYLDGVTTIRQSTLEVLAKTAGYRSWDNFIAERKFAMEANSTIVSDGVIAAADLQIGDVVEVEWKPDRRCRFRHLGSGKFEVVLSENSHLKVGDTAYAMLFVLGEPLTLSGLSHRGKIGLTYLCGGKGGLTAVKVFDNSCL